MTDLTYLFPQEPLEPDDIIVLDHLPHWLLNRELRKVFQELGLIWHGAQSVTESPDRGVAAVLHLGTMRSGPFDTEATYKSLETKLSRIRYRDPRYRLLLASTTHSGHSTNVWLRLHFMIPTPGRVILSMSTDV